MDKVFHDELSHAIDMLTLRLSNEVITPIQAYANAISSEFGSLRFAYKKVLSILDNFGDTCVSDLARQTGLSHTNMSSVLEEIERLGYVERKPNINNRRYVLVVLSPKGKEIIKDYEDTAYIKAKELFDDSLSEAEQRAFLNYANEMILLVEKIGASQKH
ncbi:MAG: MarR family transcriptional regulator [Clostridia bacterium]|nr:MarR family transcriptional regulator [Clostridia bacterium]